MMYDDMKFYDDMSTCLCIFWFLMHVQIQIKVHMRYDDMTWWHLSSMMTCQYDIHACLFIHSLISNACPDDTYPHNFYEDMSMNPWWHVHCPHACQHILRYLMHVQMHVHIIQNNLRFLMHVQMTHVHISFMMRCPWIHHDMLVSIFYDFLCKIDIMFGFKMSLHVTLSFVC